MAAGWLLAVAPWAARNAVRLAEFNERHAGRLAEPLPLFVPLTLYGPLNLALANHPGSDGTFSPAPLTAGGGTMLDLEDPRHLEMVLHGQRMAWRWAREHPARPRAWCSPSGGSRSTPGGSAGRSGTGPAG